MYKDKVSIVVIAYNEEKAIGQVLSQLAQSLTADFDYEIMLVNNGSHDRTQAIAEELRAHNARIKILSFVDNQGYGGGIYQGLAAATGEVIGYMSGDGQVPVAIVPQLLVKMFDENLDFVSAYRAVRYDGAWRKFISWVFHRLFRLMFGVYYRDINNNPKIFRRELLRAVFPIEHKDWFIDAEIVIKLAKKFPHIKIGQLPMEFLRRPGGKSKVGWGTILEFLKNMIGLYFVK